MTRSRGAAIGILLAAAVTAVAACGPARPSAPSLTSPRASATADSARLPSIAGGVRALWTGAPWVRLTLAGRDLLGTDGDELHVHAISAATGAPLWTVSMPKSAPLVLGLLPAGNVVIVAAGHYSQPYASGVFTIVSEYVALDLATGKRLWAAPVGGRSQSPVAAVSGQYLLTGDQSGAVTARVAATGKVVWRDPRPAGCGAAPGEPIPNAGLSLAADGPLLAASFTCGPRVVVQRLDPASGKPAWSWRSPPEGVYLTVISAALQGGVVLLTGAIGPPPAAQRFLSRWPHFSWPQVLGPNDAETALLALDAANGHPRWSELGGQGVTVVPTGAAECEVVKPGVECRDDATGVPTMPVLLTGRTEGSSPPYFHDGYAGVSGGLVAVTMPSKSGGVTLRVQRVRGGAIVAQVHLAIGAKAYNGALFDVFAVGAAPLGRSAILVLVRRIDLPRFPVLALEMPLPGN